MPWAASPHPTCIEILNEGKAYITILSGNYPDGELIGHFERAEGSGSFTPPPPPPAWTDDHANASAAARFLIQATFGPSPSDVAAVQSIGYTSWINNQFTLPAVAPSPAHSVQPEPRPDASLSGQHRLQRLVAALRHGTRPVAPARRVRPERDHGRLRRRRAAGQRPGPDLLLRHAAGQRLRQLPLAAQGRHP